MDSATLSFVANFLAKKVTTYLAVTLVAIGVLHTGSDQVQFETIISGVLVGLVEFAWSWWNDRGKQKVLAILARAHRVAAPDASTAAASKALVDSVNDNKVLPVAGGAVKIAAMLLIGFFVCSMAFPAFAATQSTSAAPSSTVTLTAVAQKIQQLAKPDVAYAIQLAKSVGTPQGNVRAQCYQAIQDAIPNPPSGSTAPPEPHLVTNVEELAEVIDALQPNSPLFVNCGGAAQLVSQNVLSFVNAVVTGFLGASKALPLLPVVP